MSTILLVDDDKNILFLLTEALKKYNYDLTIANGGEEAIEKLEHKNYDLIVSDLQMPRINGIDILKAGKEKNPDTEVLIITGYGSIKTAVRAMKLGAFEYLSKPVDVEELRLKVAQALKHRDLIIQIELQQKALNEFNNMIQRDLKLAEQVQKSLVAEEFKNDKIEIGVKYSPMIELGGDFADIYYNGNRYIYLTLIDVTGHGISSALLVNRICTEVRKLVRDELEPNEILFNLNNFIIDVFDQTGMFLTAFTNRYDLQKNILTFAGSSQPALILWKKQQQQFKKLSSQNVIIGYEKQRIIDFTQNFIQLSTGDKLFLYTDGITEAENDVREALGVDGFIKIITKLRNQSATKIVNSIIDRMKKEKYSQVRDDIYLIAVDIL